MNFFILRQDREVQRLRERLAVQSEELEKLQTLLAWCSECCGPAVSTRYRRNSRLEAMGGGPMLGLRTRQEL